MKTTVYVHSSKESMWEEGEKLGLKDEVLRMFSFACGELKVELEVDSTTGLVTIISVNGRKLEDE